MLAISLIALVVGCVLLFLDYSQYDSKPPEPSQGAARRQDGHPQAAAQPEKER